MNGFVLNPKLFVYFNDKNETEFWHQYNHREPFGRRYTLHQGQRDNTHQYFEENKTQRYSTQFVFDHLINENSSFSNQNSVKLF